MKQWILRHKIKLVVGLLIAATLVSTGISIYIIDRQHNITAGGTAYDRYGDSGDY